MFREIERSVRRAVRWLARSKWYVKAGIIGLVLLLVWSPPGDQLSVITGYDGIIATISDIYYGESIGTGQIFKNATSAGVDPCRGIFDDPTGVRAEIQGGVSVLDYEPRDPVTRTTQNPDGTITSERVEVQIAHCQMGVTIKTYGGGIGAIRDVVFTIRLRENDFSVFTDANATFAYILEVYTKDMPRLTGDIDVVPVSAGYSFPMETVSTEPTPAWLRDAGYTEVLGALKVVEFSITVKSAMPSSLMGLFRTEAMAVYTIGVDVLVAGHWEYTRARDWNATPPQNVFDVLWNGLGQLGQGIVGGLKELGPSVLVPIAIMAVVVLVIYSTAPTLLGRIMRR